MGQAQNPNLPEDAATSGPTFPLNVNQAKKHFRISLFSKAVMKKKKIKLESQILILKKLNAYVSHALWGRIKIKPPYQQGSLHASIKPLFTKPISLFLFTLRSVKKNNTHFCSTT